MESTEVLALPAWRQAQMIRTKEISALELMEATLSQIEAKNPLLIGYSELREDLARDGARKADAAITQKRAMGPLFGLPTAIKDCFDAAGFHTTWGTELLRDNLVEKDDISVQRLKSAGCIVVGKTNMPEFACWNVTENKLFGRTKNPHDIARIAGGSSGGAAVVIAAGMASVATGSDGGGSIRMPAAVCGTVGLKPSSGRIPTSAPDLWGGIVVTGVLTRTVRDAAIQLDVLAGPYDCDIASLPEHPTSFESALAKRVGNLRIAWSPSLGYMEVCSEVMDSCEKTIQKLRDAGHSVEEVNPMLKDPWQAGQGMLMNAGTRLTVESALGKSVDELELTPYMRRIVNESNRVTTTDYIRAQALRFQLLVQLAPIFREYDVLLTPVTATPAFRHGESPWPEKEIPLQGPGRERWYGFTYPFNLTGLPAVVVPSARTSSDLPVGIQIVGPRHGDAKALMVAAEVERIAPWHDWPI